MHRYLSYISLLLLLNSIIAQPRPKWSSAKQLFPVTIHFQNVVDTQLLHIDSTYINPHNESFTVRNFRYYISHFTVIDINGKTWQLADTYLLIDERKPESKTIGIEIPFNNISAINFTIGVDSIKNISGVQIGALDPANGMFWTWNSGYIIAKLEGTSPASKTPQNGFTYHIGGFRKDENVAREVKLILPKTVTLSIKKTADITITANVNAWFFGNTIIKITEQPSCMSPGKLAMQIADNYARMFSIK